jgi:hypothetical protein
MLGNTQLLDPMERNYHDFGKSFYYFIVGGKKRVGGLQGKNKAKTMVH